MHEDPVQGEAPQYEEADPVADAAKHLRLSLERWAVSKRALSAMETEQIRTVALAVIAATLHEWSARVATVIVEPARGG
jgi:hypothetical protein